MTRSAPRGFDWSSNMTALLVIGSIRWFAVAFPSLQ
jgi:hypothetical protein